MAQKVRKEESIGSILEKLNKELEGMPYRLDLVDPKILKTAQKNARYMKSETFRRLVGNIREDGNLSSLPFCFKDSEGVYHILSGNHRIQAAIEAGVEKVLILYSEDITRDKQLGIQLSHNAIEGEDDLAILKEIWEQIEDIDLRIYAGLDSVTLEQLDKISFEAITEQRLEYRSVSFLFLPEEIEKAEEVFERINNLFGKEDVHIVSLEKWEKFFELISGIKTDCNLKNSAAAFSRMLDLAESRMDTAANE
ncbi:MAG: ParB N-terminal domain-containing protein [Deltaproteobacteria bacterium]|nr:ParB N-terminal domain-containing protein [Deltaproteobacteria bacterium]